MPTCCCINPSPTLADLDRQKSPDSFLYFSTSGITMLDHTWICKCPSSDKQGQPSLFPGSRTCSHARQNGAASRRVKQRGCRLSGGEISVEFPATTSEAR